MIQLREQGSNLRPLGYEPNELPLLYPTLQIQGKQSTLPELMLECLQIVMIKYFFEMIISRNLNLILKIEQHKFSSTPIIVIVENTSSIFFNILNGIVQITYYFRYSKYILRIEKNVQPFFIYHYKFCSQCTIAKYRISNCQRQKYYFMDKSVCRFIQHYSATKQ